MTQKGLQHPHFIHYNVCHQLLLYILCIRADIILNIRVQLLRLVPTILLQLDICCLCFKAPVLMTVFSKISPECDNNFAFVLSTKRQLINNFMTNWSLLEEYQFVAYLSQKIVDPLHMVYYHRFCGKFVTGFCDKFFTLFGDEFFTLFGDEVASYQFL